MSQGVAVSLFKKHLRTDSEKIKVMIPRTEIVGQDGKKYYVIDTNVFIDQPGILELLMKMMLFFFQSQLSRNLNTEQQILIQNILPKKLLRKLLDIGTD